MLHRREDRHPPGERRRRLRGGQPRQARGQPVGPNHRQGGHAHRALHLRQNGSPVRSRRPHQLRQSNPTPRAHRRRQDDLHHEGAIAGAHGPWATERGKCPINKTSEDSVPRRAQIQAPQGTKSSLDIRILFSLSHRAKPLRQRTVQPSHRRPEREANLSLGKLRETQFPRESVRLPPRPDPGHITPCAAGRSCRAMTSMPMSLALP